MKFSWDWIRQHVDLEMSAAEAAELLTLHGLTVDEVIETGGDTVFDIDITANRPDAMNHRGIARELAAAAGTVVKPVEMSLEEGGGAASGAATIEIEDPVGCRRFCARVIRGVKNGPSPEWMARRLEAIGSRSIDVLVDITNYVLWELGHPLHGYDLNRVRGAKLVARRAKQGEYLRLLDGSEPKLDPEVLVIADGERAVGVGGVMGGADTELEPTTTDILLEGAYFDPVVVRRGARRLGMSTDASYRMERGVDINGPVEALARCCHLFEKLAGGRVMEGMIDTYPAPKEPVEVTMRHSRLCSFAGLEIPQAKVEEISKALEIPASRDGDDWRFEIPTRRVDIEREIDMFEEIIRIVGYHNVPPTLPVVDQEPADRLRLHQVIDAADGLLLASGYTEVANYDFIDPTENAIFAPEGAGEPIKVLNPIAEPQMSIMRQSLAPSLLGNIRYNFNRGVSGMRIFEIARVFFDGEEAPAERTTLCICADAAEPAAHWLRREHPADFFEIKGVMELLFTRLGLRDMIISQGNRGFLQPLERADVYHGNELVGWFGRLSDGAQAHYDIPHPVYIGQLDLDAVAGDALPERRFSRGSRYPSVSRDLSFTLAADVAYRQVLEAIEAAGITETVDIVLLDLYRGEATGGKTNLTVRVVYQSDERTLTQDEVEAFHGKVRDSLRKLGVEFR